MEQFKDGAKCPKKLEAKLKAQEESDMNDSNRYKEMYEKLGENLGGMRFGLMIDEAQVATEHMSPEEAAHFVNHRIKFLKQTYAHWTGIGPTRNLSDPKMLVLYEDLYNDMITNTEEWEKYFSNIKNVTWCERSVGMINSYATVIRQRAEAGVGMIPSGVMHELLVKCEQILNLGGKQLVKYKAMTYHPDALSVVWSNNEVASIRDKQCCRGLTFKYLLIKHNLLMMTNRTKYTNPNEVRFMCEYELETYPDPSCDDCPGRAYVLLRTLRRPLTRQALDAVTNRYYRTTIHPLFSLNHLPYNTLSHL